MFRRVGITNKLRAPVARTQKRSETTIHEHYDPDTHWKEARVGQKNAPISKEQIQKAQSYSLPAWGGLNTGVKAVLIGALGLAAWVEVAAWTAALGPKKVKKDE